MCPNMSIKEYLHPLTKLWVDLLHVHIYLPGGGEDHITGLFFFFPLRGGGQDERLFAPIRTVGPC